MSGFEIAGIVLATIPLLVAVVKRYAEEKQKEQWFSQYKNPLDDLARNLQTEFDIFQNTCELLLDGLVDPSRIHELLEDPKNDAWEDSVLRQNIKRRLGRSFEGYWQTMDDIVSIVDEFKRLLGTDANGQPQFAEMSRPKRVLRRLKMSSKRSACNGLIQSLKERNSTLETLTRQNVHLEPKRARRVRGSPNFKSVRRHASNLYKTLTNNFRCDCKTVHSLSIRLECHRNCYEGPHDAEEPERTPIFRVIFSSANRKSLPQTNQWEFEPMDIMVINKVPRDGHTFQTDGRRVRFANDSTSPDTPVPIPSLWQAGHPQIQDLCIAIGQSRQLCSGSILGSVGSTFNVSKPKELTHDPSPPTRSSLAEVLSRGEDAEGVKLRHSDRLCLAVVLASSLLQLHRTPWISEGWGADNIYFLECTNSNQLLEPFLERPCIQDSPTKTRISLRDMSMQHGIRDQHLFILGIMLIELCLQAPFQVLKERSRSSGTRNDSFDSDFNIISQLVTEVYNESGIGYGDAVQGCIGYDYNSHTATISYEEMCKIVYNVISLLEDDLKDGYGISPMT